MNESSTGFACENSICVLSGVKFLFKGNECDQDYDALMESMNVITKLEKGSFVRFTHNKIYRTLLLIVVLSFGSATLLSSLALGNYSFKR